jgi:tetratricopeptide (TPR) repeat protein
MEKRWSKAEIAHLKRNADSQGAGELAQRFHTDAGTVRRKLEELGLGSAESASEAKAALEDFGKALEALHGGQFDQAAKLLESVVEGADNVQLADRARQHLEICRARMAEAADGGDPYLRAVFEKNNGNLDQALELCQQQKGAADDERYAYLMASIRALTGDQDEALKLLRTSIRLEPKNRIHAYHDPDFEPLRGRDEFARLVRNASAAG